MRFLLAVLAALLCCPAVAGAAPFAEPPFTPLARDRAATCLQAAGAGRVAVLGTTRAGASAVELLRVAANGAAVREGSVPFDGFDCPSAAVAPSGAAVVAAASTEPENSMDVILATRDPGGVLRAPVRVPRTERIWVQHIAAAIASSGAAVVTWVETPTDGVDSIGDDRLMVIRRPAGGAFGAPERLPGRVDGYSTEPVVGIDDAGRATIAWSGDVERDDVVRVATAKPGTAFGAQRLTHMSSGRLSLSVAADGGALLAYEEQTEEASRIRVFERAPGAGRMTSVPSFLEEESADREHLQVALAPKGGAMVAWKRERDDDRGPVVEAALREPGSAFQPPEALDAALRTAWDGQRP